MRFVVRLTLGWLSLSSPCATAAEPDPQELVVQVIRTAGGEARLLELFRFSEWKKTENGCQYPSHVVGFRFENRGAGSLKDKQWYQTDILELTPLSELPSELKR